ncbi:MAG: translocation/assembly module TamB [Cyclobacteriaceae bacterium]|jgi:hypothetical protein|nr:translocation/assembly module TamB [Cyclobacteriaceae bacterium]
MRLQVIKNRLLLWLRRVVLYGLLATLVALFVGFFVLQIPAVQTRLSQRVLARFGSVSGFTITYDRLHFVWYDRLRIEGLLIRDPAQNVMIAAERLQVNFNLNSLLAHNEVNLDGARLQNTQVNLIKLQRDTLRDLNMNFFIAEINKATASGQGGGTSPKVNIGEIVLDQSSFSYLDPFQDSIATGFDYQHFRLGIPTAEVGNFKVIGDTIQMQVRSLVAEDQKTHLAIKELRTFFRISQKGMEFYNAHFRVNNSEINDTIAFFYESQRDFSDFNNKVTILAKLKNTTLDPADLDLFAPGVKFIGRPLHAQGVIRGRVTRLSYQNMDVRLGTSRLVGRLTMDGLPTVNETFMQIDLKDSRIHFADLETILGKSVTEPLRPLGTLALSGSFTGFVNDFVAKGVFQSKLGKIASDINLKINPDDPRQSAYRGKLQLTNFELGTFLNDTSLFQRVTMAGEIRGKGFSLASTEFTLNGEVPSIGIRGYTYRNITTNATFASQLFNGEVKIDDPNLQLAATGTIDFRNANEAVRIRASLDTAFVHRLGFIQEPLFVQTELDIDSRGLTLDSLFGDATFNHSTIAYQDKQISLDSIHVRSQLQNGIRSLSLESSIANVALTGTYAYTTLFADAQKLIHEFVLNIKNDKEKLRDYYASKKTADNKYEADFSVLLKTLAPVSHLIGRNIELSKNTAFTGRFSNDYTSRLKFYSQIDTLYLEGQQWNDVAIDFNGSKIRDSTDVLAMLTITSAEQRLSKVLTTEDLLVEAIWNGDHIDASLDVAQKGYAHAANIRSMVDFDRDSTLITFLPSTIRLLGTAWRVSTANQTRVKGNEWSIQNLQFANGNQSVRVDGHISNDPTKKLNLRVQDFSLNVLKTLTGIDLTGTVNGEVTAGDLYREPYVQNDISIDQLEIDQFLIGNVTGTNIWNRSDNQFDINLLIDRLGDRTLSLGGYYRPSEKNGLHLIGKLDKTNLKLAEPFLRGIFSKMDGTLTGQYTILGSFREPRIEGEGNIENGRLTVDYLKTDYSVSGVLAMSPSQVIFRNIEMTDAFGNGGTLNGYLGHRFFRDMRINLEGQFRNFQVLNTTSKDNELFYGQAYATGQLSFTGPLANMKISATARTEKKTRIFIPISGTKTVERKDYILFTPFSDTAYAKKTAAQATRKTQTSGLTMDFNLDITPDAYAEIIFDIKAGDIVRGYGKGDIKLQLDTKGEFNMFGVYEFERGFYNFTLYDIINKEFLINKGSRITWYGSPYTGTLDLDASYRQLASLSPILTDQTLAGASAVRRKYPVEVLLTLDGPMLSPQINFDIAAKDLPDNLVAEDGRSIRLQFEFNAFKARLDEQELKRQVFSLIVLRRFSPPDAFATSGSLYNSVSELLSNQLSYWLTQVDSNLEIDLDLGTLDQESFNTFQLRLSYSFFNGRLRVTRDGTFTNQSNRSDVASLAGDWTVDYSLTADGKFKVKMYSRSNFNQVVSTLGNQNAVTTGVSLSHTQSFNRISDLWRSARERRRRELEEAAQQGEPNDPDDDSQ